MTCWVGDIHNYSWWPHTAKVHLEQVSLVSQEFTGIRGRDKLEKTKCRTVLRQTQNTPRNKGVLPPCCNTINGPIGSAETITPRKQARCAGDITPTGGLSRMGAGGCRGGSSGLGADTLSLLIIVWLLHIFKYTSPWHRRRNRRRDATLRLHVAGGRRETERGGGRGRQWTKRRMQTDNLKSSHESDWTLTEAREQPGNKQAEHLEAHDNETMTTVVSSAFQYVQQCPIIPLTQYIKGTCCVCTPRLLSPHSRAHLSSSV